jgi:hypothetical protein
MPGALLVLVLRYLYPLAHPGESILGQFGEEAARLATH